MKPRGRILLAIALVGALGAQTRTGFKLVVGPVPQDFELTPATPREVVRGGTPMAEVTTDFYGRPRDPEHPSMGAIEYSGSTNAAPIEWFGTQAADETGHGVRGSGTLKASAFMNSVATGTLTDLEIHVFAGAPTNRIKLYVYASSGSLTQPGALLLTAGEIRGPVAGWNRIPGLSLTVTRDTWYWLAWECAQDLDVWHSQTNGFWYAAKSFGDPAPAQFPTAQGASVNTSLRGRVQPAMTGADYRRMAEKIIQERMRK